MFGFLLIQIGNSTPDNFIQFLKQIWQTGMMKYEKSTTNCVRSSTNMVNFHVSLKRIEKNWTKL